MDDKRMIGDYTVLNSMYVGHKEIAICENQKAAKDERYLCCYIENVIVFERYTEALVSDDFAEIAQVYGERIASAAEEIIKETEKANEQVGANAELFSAPGSCGKGNRPACVPAAASLYRGYLSCVPSILLSVAVLPEKVSCPIPAACSGVGTLPTASGQVVPK